MEYGDGKPNLLNLLLGANGQGDRVYSGCRALFTSVQLKGTDRSPSTLTKTAGARLGSNPGINAGVRNTTPSHTRAKCTLVWNSQSHV